MSKTVPYYCPKCVTEEGFWAYAILVWEGKSKPCPNCGSALGPVRPPDPR